MRLHTAGKVALVLAVLALAAGAGIIGYGAWTADRLFEGAGARQDEALARTHQAFLDDQRLAGTMAILAIRRGNRDASGVLGPRMRWWAPPEALQRYRGSLPLPDRQLTLPPGTEEKLGREWMDADRGLWSGLDFTWMAGLGAMDFWDLDRGPAVPRESLHGPEPGVDAVFWGKLRLAKGLAEGAVPAAAGEVEELARLCASTEELNMTRQALALLAYADQARERAGLTSASELADRKEARRRADRAVLAAQAYARLRTPPRFDGDWVQVRAGRCAALRHGLEIALHLRPLLGEARAEDYRHLGRLLESAPECRLEGLRARWSSPDTPEDLAAVRAEGWMRVFMVVPGSQRRVGQTLLAISEQDYLKRYTEDVPGPRDGAPATAQP